MIPKIKLDARKSAGLGKEIGRLIGSDRSIEGGIEGAAGGALGAGLLVCRKRVTNACSK